ncbi:MAG: TetR/AcrR family transcriptional regulator [Candidatus Pelethousia sp.]|nr:TetR/AcrR family transcriptional regulator [Candidatus Pelethousia sp.]
MPRAKQQSEEVRGRILETARRIIEEMGVEALSIRQITNEMGYSPGIVYHYFRDKDEILSCVLQDSYKRILSAIRPLRGDLAPDEAIRLSITNYIESALQWPAEYKAIMLSASPQILNFTSVLGADDHSPALAALIETLEAGIEAGLFAPCDVKTTAGAIWSAMFGLLIRLIIERGISSEQRAGLIARQIEIILKGLKP